MQIYAVAEPQGLIRYIGFTSVGVERRLQAHKTSASPIGEWVKCNEYVSFVLEECPLHEARRKERFWIVQCRAAGHPLLNANGFSINYDDGKNGNSVTSIGAPASEFEAFEQAAFDLRMTIGELTDCAGVTRVRYWRAKTGISGDAAKAKVMRQIEATIEWLKIAPSACSTCGKSRRDQDARNCNQFGCAMPVLPTPSGRA